MKNNRPSWPLYIDRLALEGEGVGRFAQGEMKGKVAFIPYVLPGEDVDVQLLVDKKDFARGMPTRVVRGSPSRTKPRCPLHFQPGGLPRWCGGCDWQHMTTAFQKLSKSQMLQETLLRMGGLVSVSMNPLLAGKNDWRYRNKVQVPFQVRGRALLAGFFAPGSHDIVNFDDCVIQPEVSINIVRTVKSLIEKYQDRKSVV